MAHSKILKLPLIPLLFTLAAAAIVAITAQPGGGVSATVQENPPSGHPAANTANQTTNPGMLLAVTEGASEVLMPSELMPWIINCGAADGRPIWLGQLTACAVDGVPVAVTAPHCIDLDGPPRKLPAYVRDLPWTHRIEGREISLAPIAQVGLLAGMRQIGPILEARPPKTGSEAVLRAVKISAGSLEALVVSTRGTLRERSDIEHLASACSSERASSTYDRFAVRAPKLPVLVMEVERQAYDRLPQQSGGLVYQDGFPVAVFFGRLELPDGTRLALMEPLLEPARKALAAKK